jgi:hypothetical protein
LNSWPLVRRFFEEDDGSLPDIFIENLSVETMEAVYALLLQQSSDDVRGYAAWSPEFEREAYLSEFESPVRAYSTGRIDSFRHPLIGLKVDGIELPLLTVCIEPSCISLDYRKGPEWCEANARALSELLRSVRRIAPLSHIYHAEEGQFDNPSREFSEAFELFLLHRRL